jgi:hypothetical protein
MKARNIILFFGFLILLPFVSKAQQKYEREYRIKSEIIPPSANAFIGSIGSDHKIKWYKEISLHDVTIEAKFKHNMKKFSVEFDTLGILQDVEFIIDKREITPVVYKRIKHKLDILYQKWKFQKIQIHYRGNPRDIITSINKNKPCKSIKVYYEIVLKGKSSGSAQLYEITFSEQGEIQGILQIIQDKADHLEY